MKDEEYEEEERLYFLETLVSDCFLAKQESIIVKLIMQLEDDYRELATLGTMGKYEPDWTHREVLDYITKEL